MSDRSPLASLFSSLLAGQMSLPGGQGAIPRMAQPMEQASGTLPVEFSAVPWMVQENQNLPAVPTGGRAQVRKGVKTVDRWKPHIMSKPEDNYYGADADEGAQMARPWVDDANPLWK